MSFTFDGSGNAVLANGGTASAPAIRIRNATNTGIYSAQDNQVGIAVAGSARIEVLSQSTKVNNDFVCNSHTETVSRLGFTTGARTLTTSGVQRVTLTGNSTFSMPGAATAHAGRSIMLFVLTGAGGFTATFNGVRWPNNTAPVLTTSAQRMDIFCFVSDGFNWFGSVVQKYNA